MNKMTGSNGEPCIGLALGSGAAKGFAHIGVLKELDEMGIRPQVIAGTSMGAFVGAAYSAGCLDKLERWVRQLDNWKVFSLLDINWTLNGGVIGGIKPFRAFFEGFDYENIEDLPLPFTAVATDLHSGQEIWLQEGNLQDAVSASCSIPGLLSPKSLAGRWLVDGAVVNPVPVDVCRAMGATVVIAVDVTEDGRPKIDREHGEVKRVVSQRSTYTQQSELERESEEIAETASGDKLDPSANLPRPPVKENAEDRAPPGVSGFSRLMEQGMEQLNQIRSRRDHKSTPPGMFDTMRKAMEVLERRHKRTRMMGSPPDVLIMPKVGAISGTDYAHAAQAIEAGQIETRRLRTWIEDMIERA
ncbi:patatin-like phospholipase family protein [Microbulbifer bruguierae]|uniref:Patatin-like phospholipase family protein n=1 Tax=Microbulbifer bruguierae TaxID=3029061 RepID=A0ABY8N905_9GAMM|nr:patatin-like phospholipase family protein [Microbulbifer bruguierae]WGL15381.1 patatin-like phospholipase family protein [Microbulbifer bruguierae]